MMFGEQWWIRAVGEGGCLEGWIRVRLSGAPGVG